MPCRQKPVRRPSPPRPVIDNPPLTITAARGLHRRDRPALRQQRIHRCMQHRAPIEQRPHRPRPRRAQSPVIPITNLRRTILPCANRRRSLSRLEILAARTAHVQVSNRIRVHHRTQPGITPCIPAQRLQPQHQILARLTGVRAPGNPRIRRRRIVNPPTVPTKNRHSGAPPNRRVTIFPFRCNTIKRHNHLPPNLSRKQPTSEPYTRNQSYCNGSDAAV